VVADRERHWQQAEVVHGDERRILTAVSGGDRAESGRPDPVPIVAAKQEDGTADPARQRARETWGDSLASDTRILD
jgi:hypothetical protein